ncbi:hypothetical protein [Novosphingobium malaysiense]|uniref:Uncharacterized protein n=1 Tax=Novosphingobium malaysiense TaxID=1348853 RepID=A0A0B1ZQY2_9SPHN|nr:hypothetical protein [Novosphingobium malaysiense]KHK93011.1 hypothetical protein LK12_01085 [Novosphingobium malaysiense]
MSGSDGIRGQPLVALLAVLAGWIGGRAINWEAPRLSDVAAVESAGWVQPESAVGFVIDGRAGPQSLPLRVPLVHGGGYPPVSAAGRIVSAVPWHVGTPPFSRLADDSRPPPSTGSMRPRGTWGATGSDLGPTARMFMPLQGSAASGAGEWLDPGQRFYAPETGSASPSAAPRAAPPVPEREARGRKRWSLDTWALLRREGGGSLSPGVLPATYGGSQTGAVLRYRVDMSSRYRPTLFARTTTALGTIRENSAALGMSARPFPSLPLVAAVEGRMTDQAGVTRFQPAAFAYTQLAPVRLPGKLRGEAYFQGGYVGGRFATPFADGQLRVDRRVLKLGSIRTYLGAGAWGGVQKGAARLDLGPSAFIAFPINRRMFARVAIDWRFRVAGRARPGSGPALTLSAGF